MKITPEMIGLAEKLGAPPRRGFWSILDGKVGLINSYNDGDGFYFVVYEGSKEIYPIMIDEGGVIFPDLGWLLDRLREYGYPGMQSFSSTPAQKEEDNIDVLWRVDFFVEYAGKMFYGPMETTPWLACVKTLCELKNIRKL